MRDEASEAAELLPCESQPSAVARLFGVVSSRCTWDHVADDNRSQSVVESKETCSLVNRTSVKILDGVGLPHCSAGSHPSTSEGKQGAAPTAFLVPCLDSVFSFLHLRRNGKPPTDSLTAWRETLFNGC